MISNFTSRAGDLDILASGENVVAPSISGGSHIYLKGSGTSFAAPEVAGAAMLLHQANPKLNITQIISILKTSASKNWDGDLEYPATYLTYRRLDLDNAIRSALSKKSKTTRTATKARPQAERVVEAAQKKPDLIGLFNAENRIGFD
jgi:subtilisin family serine protease